MSKKLTAAEKFQKEMMVQMERLYSGLLTKKAKGGLESRKKKRLKNNKLQCKEL